MTEILSDLAWFDFLEAHGLEWLPVYLDIIVMAAVGVFLAGLGIYMLYDYLKNWR